MKFDDDGNIECPRCKGKGEKRKRFYYKKKSFYYYSKCGFCRTKGYVDWITFARGRSPGIKGMFVDNHPAGSYRALPDNLGGTKIYDGHEYIDIRTELGKALYNKFWSTA